MNIPEMWLEIKPALIRGASNWAIPAVVLLVAAASFGLGRLSGIGDVRASVSITHAESAPKPRAMYEGGQFVASKTGTTYQFPWCAGAEKIPSEKQLRFATEKEALAAGFVASKTCKGLE